VERLLLVRCPDLLAPDDGGEALRCFARVVEAVRASCPWVSAVAPGVCTLPARGPSRFFGGEEEVVRLVRAAVTAVEGAGPVEVGVADGLFAAHLAAQAGIVVPAGRSAAFLEPWPLSVLGRPELEELLQQLGIRSLGAFAALSERHVLARLGSDGVACHRIVRGLDGELPGLRQPVVERHLRRLGGEASTVSQASFWGGRQGADTRAAEVLGGVQQILGADAVCVAHWQGGRAPADQIRTVTWAASAPQRLRPGGGGTAPWPGRLPSPAPTLVHQDPLRVELVGRDDRPASVAVRGTLSCPLARLSIAGGPWVDVRAWAGPWPTWERWWTPSRRRVARLQVVTTSGLAHLLTAQHGSWWLSATYD
jgi:protein ImuB